MPGTSTSTFFALFFPVARIPTLSYFVGVSGSSKPAMRVNRTGAGPADPVPPLVSRPLPPAPAVAAGATSATTTAATSAAVHLRAVTRPPTVANDFRQTLRRASTTARSQGRTV